MVRISSAFLCITGLAPAAGVVTYSLASYVLRVFLKLTDLRVFDDAQQVVHRNQMLIFNNLKRIRKFPVIILLIIIFYFQSQTSSVTESLFPEIAFFLNHLSSRNS
uniref:Putative secreted protein n=1 Tax=Ixodes ricinus TaxID=34613 RepID=A0A6B0UGK2_IXORI